MSRALRRSTGWVSLLLFLSVLALPLSSSHLQWDDDVACGSGGLAPARAGQAITEVDHAAPVPVHCAFCHWLRTMASAAAGQPLLVLRHVGPAELSLVPASSAPAQAVLSNYSSRAPPAAAPGRTILA